MAFDLEALKESVIDGNAKKALALTQEALAEGVAPESLINDGLIPAMSTVGKYFEEGEFFVPEMLIAARAMQGSLDILRPLVAKSGMKPLATVVVGTVKGDLHDIGKNLVKIMLEGAGCKVIDLGTDVSPEKYVQSAKDEGADIIALSALLTTTMPNMKGTVDAVDAAGLKGKVKVIIGGAPVTDSYARQIGADGYAPDASRAANLVRNLMGLAAA
jgi:5-methyltetrahydrofolate--homocysteine methyltransferase